MQELNYHMKTLVFATAHFKYTEAAPGTVAKMPA